MSNRLNLSDAINSAFDTGKDPTFVYEGVTYTFSPLGLIEFFTAMGFLTSVPSNPSFSSLTVSGTVTLSNLPSADPEIEGVLWNDAGTVKVSSGV